MATVVVTFFLFALFNVYKMDADWIESQRDSFLIRREKRWSMNSQRLEEIVAELMKPISNDNRRSFDTDLSALLEEYLTQAGLHALECDEHDEVVAAPNFTEIALLLQQSANIYGRKVDFLYQRVISVSEAIHTAEESCNNNIDNDERVTQTTSRRKRKCSSLVVGEFVEIELETCAAATRERESPRPPPTLARLYCELEPRMSSSSDIPLYDYSDEHIGILGDYHLSWRLHDGLLVDEMEGGASRDACALRALSLVELQAALEARAPASPPSSLVLLTPLHHSTPTREHGHVNEHEHVHVVKRERKRRSGVHIDNLFDDNIKIIISKDLMRKLRKVQDFCIDKRWIETVVKKRKSNILCERKRLLQETPPDKGFRGWSSAEVSMAADAALALRSAYGELESDDDGFFEQSGEEDNVRAVSKHITHMKDVVPVRTEEQCAAVVDSGVCGETADVGESCAVAVVPECGAGAGAAAGEEAQAPLPLQPAIEVVDPEAAARAAALSAWRADVLRRAAESEARGAPDVHALADRVLGALDDDAPRSFTEVLREQAQHQSDVSRLTLAALFLANSANVEIVSGAPLSLDSFSLRLLSRDTSRYAHAADAARELFR